LSNFKFVPNFLYKLLHFYPKTDGIPNLLVVQISRHFVEICVSFY
jgi:hypothetical protein